MVLISSVINIILLSWGISYYFVNVMGNLGNILFERPTGGERDEIRASLRKEPFYLALCILGLWIYTLLPFRTVAMFALILSAILLGMAVMYCFAGVMIDINYGLLVRCFPDERKKVRRTHLISGVALLIFCGLGLWFYTLLVTHIATTYAAASAS
jgi:hypothetical protein